MVCSSAEEPIKISLFAICLFRQINGWAIERYRTSHGRYELNLLLRCSSHTNLSIIFTFACSIRTLLLTAFNFYLYIYLWRVYCYAPIDEYFFPAGLYFSHTFYTPLHSRFFSAHFVFLVFLLLSFLLSSWCFVDRLNSDIWIDNPFQRRIYLYNNLRMTMFCFDV